MRAVPNVVVKVLLSLGGSVSTMLIVKRLISPVFASNKVRNVCLRRFPLTPCGDRDGDAGIPAGNALSGRNLTRWWS